MRPRLPRLPKIDGNSLARGSASASARISVEIRIVPSGKRGGVRITDNATESRLKLQLVHLTLESFNLVLLDSIEHLLDSSSRVRIDRCGVLSRIVVHTIDGTLSLAATSSKLLRGGSRHQTMEQPPINSLLNVYARNTEPSKELTTMQLRTPQL